MKNYGVRKGREKDKREKERKRKVQKFKKVCLKRPAKCRSSDH